jgi:hypothetical protein
LQTGPRVHVYLVGADEYSADRVRLALLPDPTWILEQVALNQISQTAAKSMEPQSPGVVLIPAAEVLQIYPHPLPLPVLAVGPPSLFDAVPPGFCDDLMSDQWTAAELRYRLRRLVEADPSFGGVSCPPLRMTAGDRSVDLTTTQYRIVSMLLRAEGASVSREALSGAICTAERSGTDGRALDMHISRVRKKLQTVTLGLAYPPRIIAHRGSGYSVAR